MKRSLIYLLAFAALSRTVLAQSNTAYTNNTAINFTTGTGVAPQIDAGMFVNNGQFSITLTGTGFITGAGITFVNSQFPPFEFSDVTNFINRGEMDCDAGFLFDTEPSGFGVPHPATSFTNSNLGSISSGSFNGISGGFFFAGPGFDFVSGAPYLQVSATNIVNRGVLDVGINGFMGISGGTVDLSRGTTHVEGFDDPGIYDNNPSIGLFNLYWGLGMETNFQNQANITVPPFFSSPLIIGTSSSGISNISSLFLTSAEAFANTNMVNGSNYTYQVVLINTNLPGISTDVRFEPFSDFDIPTIRWTMVLTNSPILAPITNFLYLQDKFGAVTNFEFVTNNFTLSGLPQSRPFNYSFTRALPFDFNSLVLGNTLYTPGNIANIFTNAFPETNQYSAYAVLLSPVTTIPDPSLVYSTVSNAPGRVAINASGSLNLAGSSLTGPNYLSLYSTNNFLGSAGAVISAPFLDINLGYTNPSTLAITNLVQPYLYRSEGEIQMWSARWTNIVNNITNSYHIFMVDPEFTATSQVQVVNFRLATTNKTARTGGNVVLNDVLSVDSKFVLSAQSLTVETNAAGAANSEGELNLLTESISQATLPGLEYLTNWGQISALNISDNLPLLINHGTIFASGITLSDNDFESTGGPVSTNFFSSGSGNSVTSDFGPINIQSANMVLSRGTLAALDSSGDINLSVGNLTMSNEVLQASGALTLSINNSVNYTPDGRGAYWRNSWTVDDGFNLAVKPATGDFLNTTVDDICPSGSQISHTWAGVDFGPTAAGFSNNAALGYVVLDGIGTDCSFLFTGASTNNAIYIDELDLRGNATNIVTASQGFTALLNIDSNMRIYFADAVINGGTLDVSQRLDAQPGGRIRWVRDYAGLFSGTNITYRNGITYSFNRALASSTTIDSDGSGVANAFNPFPFNVNPVVTVANQTASISWEGAPNSTNYVYSSASLTSTNWTLLTTIPQGPVGSPVTVTDPVSTNHARYYQIKIAQ